MEIDLGTAFLLICIWTALMAPGWWCLARILDKKTKKPVRNYLLFVLALSGILVSSLSLIQPSFFALMVGFAFFLGLIIGSIYAFGLEI